MKKKFYPEFLYKLLSFTVVAKLYNNFVPHYFRSDKGLHFFNNLLKIRSLFKKKKVKNIDKVEDNRSYKNHIIHTPQIVKNKSYQIQGEGYTVIQNVFLTPYYRNLHYFLSSSLNR